MRFLIWVICFLPLAIILTLFQNMGIQLGAIPTAILAGFAFWCEKRLRIAWGKHKGENAIPESSAAPEPAPEPLAEEPTVESPAVLPASEPSTPKPRFCKHCGSLIDPATRKCTGCSKQYFRPPILRKRQLAIVTAALACAAVALVIFHLASRLNEAELQIAMQNSKIQIQNNQISKLEDTVDDLERQINIYKRNESTYLDKLSETESEIELFENRAVIAVIVTKIYHTYGCPYLDLDMGYRIYDAFGARSNDYTPCPHCCD